MMLVLLWVPLKAGPQIKTRMKTTVKDVVRGWDGEERAANKECIIKQCVGNWSLTPVGKLRISMQDTHQGYPTQGTGLPWHNKIPRPGSIKNKNLRLTVMEAARSKFKVRAVFGFWRELSSWLADSHCALMWPFLWAQAEIDLWCLLLFFDEHQLHFYSLI